MKLTETIDTLLAEANLPFEKTKRVEQRKEGESSTYVEVPSGKTHSTAGLGNVIGWFSNKHNPAWGWSIHELTPSEKKEFGSKNVFRTSNDKSMNIVKINPEKGTYAFVDTKEYEEEGRVKFEKMTPYKKLIIDHGKSKHFGIF